MNYKKYLVEKPMTSNKAGISTTLSNARFDIMYAVTTLTGDDKKKKAVISKAWEDFQKKVLKVI